MSVRDPHAGGPAGRGPARPPPERRDGTHVLGGGAEKLPGRTRERTHYTLTGKGREALAAWVRTPAALLRIQNEPIVRFLAADLVPADGLLEGLEAPERWEQTAPHRVEVLTVNVDWAKRALRLQLEWLDEAERTLTRRRA